MVHRPKQLLNDLKLFRRLRSRLDVAADDHAIEILLYAPDLTDQELADVLETRLGLEPLSLGEPTAVRVMLDPCTDERGREQYLHQMTVPYGGSQLLWKARPMPHGLLPLFGKASRTTLTVEWLMPDQNYGGFKAFAGYCLAAAASALPLLEPDIIKFNSELPLFCANYVAARAEELVAWRRRGHQRRERDAKRQDFEASQPAIDPVMPAWKLRVAELLQARLIAA